MSDRADVLIVGAGASGGVAALRLAGAGLRVVCLEQGEWQDPTTYPGAGPDWELLARKQWTSSPNVRGGPADYPIDLEQSDMDLGNFNGVGGGTILYSAVWPRLLPSDFRTASALAVGDDWPLSYAELQPFYEETDRQFGVSGLGGNPAYPLGADPPLPPLPIGRAGLALARAHARLGWHWWPEYNAILSADHDGRHVCVQRGSCGSGCNEGAKGSTDVTHWPLAVSAGVRLVTGARVRAVEVDGRGRARGATWLDREGREHFQPADVVLCAANGIGTARLLLLSAHAGAPEGLANSSGLVGRRLMVHPGALVDGYFEEDLESFRGHFGGQIQSLEFAGTDPGRGFVGGTKWSLAPTGGPLAVAFGLRGRPVLGTEHHAHMRSRFGHGARWVVLCEDLPDPTNRVKLSASLVDASGIPAPEVQYRLSDDVRRATEWSIERASMSLVEAGAHTVDSVPMRSNSHLLGTARMGDDPSSSVVDCWGVTHDVPNLAIVDGSVFVTVGAANPTSTICALALRAVEHLLERRADVPVPEPTRSFAAPRSVADVSPATVVPLAREERERFAKFADVLVPPDERMPAPSDVGVQQELLDEVLRARPDLVDGLRRALAHPTEHLEELRAHDTAAYHALVLVAIASYYRSPVVQTAIGYPGPVPTPVPRFEFPEYLDEGLLEHVLEGEIFMTVGVVTGAASGMGRACVDRLLGTVDQLLAVDVATVDIPGTESVQCDVRDDDAIGALVERVRERGPFRFLVHAAGLSPTMADARTIVDVNLVGTARILDAFEPLVTVGSVAVPFASSAGYLQDLLGAEQLALLVRTREPGVLDQVAELITDSGIAYLYSKVGVQLEARMAAARWATLGGRVVSLSPGNIDTPMGRLELEHQPLMREAQATHPMQRLGDPREIAAVVAFLVSDDASFVSGVDVLVDGAERAYALGATVSR